MSRATLLRTAPLLIAFLAGQDRVLALDFFHAEGRHLVSDTTGESYVFRGVNLTGLEFGTFFDHPYPGTPGTDYFVPRTEDFDAIEQLGFNVVRVPFEWARLVPGWTPGSTLPTELDPDYLGLLDDIVTAAARRDIQVILDMHDFLKYWPGENQNPECVDSSPDHQALLSHTWMLIASHFTGDPAVLGFDLMNEPVREETGEPCGSCQWHSIAQAVVDAIRMVNVDHLILVEGPNFSLASDWPVENESPFITDAVNPPRVVYSPHVYFDFNNDSRYEADEKDAPIGPWQHYLRDRLLAAIYWSIEHDVPLFFGEMGVPCTAGWAAVLDHAFDVFFDPMHLSTAVWQYIDPTHCKLEDCPLNLLACPRQHQLDVLVQHLGGTFAEPDSLTPVPVSALVYGDERVNPWNAGSGYFDSSPPGIEVDFCVTNPVFEGSCAISVEFTANNFAALKLAHHFGLDALDYDVLRFRIFFAGDGMQDLEIFTTRPLADCDREQDPVYPPERMQPTLSDYLVNPLPGVWQRVEIPLHAGSPQGPIVDPRQPILNAVAFQNLGVAQPPFFLDELRLVRSPIFGDGFESGDVSPWSGAVGTATWLSRTSPTTAGVRRGIRMAPISELPRDRR